MSHRLVMKCPVRIDDDICWKEIEIEFTDREPQTWNYPGAPPEFEVIEAKCGHKDVIEAEYKDEVWNEVADRRRAQLDALAEDRYYRQRWDRRWGWD